MQTNSPTAHLHFNNYKQISFGKEQFLGFEDRKEKYELQRSSGDFWESKSGNK
jgi:hypothetical protein